MSKAQSKAQLNLSKQKFREDDSWKENELPQHLQNLKYMNLEQLERLMRWKLRRGMFRPTLMGLIRRNKGKDVIEITRLAFEAARRDMIEGFVTLNKLQGVGPATASAILSVCMPSTVAFMSDEAMDAALGLPRLYSQSQFIKFQKALKGKAKELGSGWSPDMVEKALWCAAMISKFAKT